MKICFATPTLLLTLSLLAFCSHKTPADAGMNVEDTGTAQKELNAAPSSLFSSTPLPGAQLWKDSNLRIESAFTGSTWQLSVVGNLPNSCYQFSHLDIQKTKDTEYLITPYAVIKGASMCLMVMKPVMIPLTLKETLREGQIYRFLITKGYESHTLIEVKIPTDAK